MMTGARDNAPRHIVLHGWTPSICDPAASGRHMRTKMEHRIGVGQAESCGIPAPPGIDRRLSPIRNLLLQVIRDER